MFRHSLLPLFTLCLFVCVCQAQNPLVIKAGKVHTGDGNVLTDVFVVVQDGKIAYIGKGYSVKPEDDVLDL